MYVCPKIPGTERERAVFGITMDLCAQGERETNRERERDFIRNQRSHCQAWVSGPLSWRAGRRAFPLLTLPQGAVGRREGGDAGEGVCLDSIKRAV